MTYSKTDKNTNKTLFTNWTLESMDLFGGNLTFNINKKKMFRTRLGGIFSIIFVMINITILHHFFSKVADTSTPIIDQNLYYKDEIFKADLNSYNIYHYFIARNMETKSNIEPNIFWRSFHIEASIVNTKSDVVTYQKIEIIPCILLDWTDTIEDVAQKDIIKNYGICLKKSDVTQDILYKSLSLNTKLVVNLYTCQNNLDYNCNSLIDRQNLEFSVNVHEENYDLINYDKPKNKLFRNIRLFYPSSSIVTQDTLSLRKTFLRSDHGKLVAYYHSENILEQHDLKTSIREVITNQSYYKNFVQHSSSFDSDTQYQLEITGSHFTKTISRRYYNLIGALSNIGGSMKLITAIIYLLYTSYNLYFLYKEIVVNTVISKDVFMSNDYKIKKNYFQLNYSRFIKIFCYCCRFYDKKAMNGPSFNNKLVVFEGARDIIAERCDIKNFIGDSIDFQAIRYLCLKSRHKFLMPLLTMELYKKRQLEHTKNDVAVPQFYALRQKYDMPVFTVEDAIRQIKSVAYDKTEVENNMDEWFQENLPDYIVENVFDLSNVSKSECKIKELKKIDNIFKSNNSIKSRRKANSDIVIPNVYLTSVSSSQFSASNSSVIQKKMNHLLNAKRNSLACLPMNNKLQASPVLFDNLLTDKTLGPGIVKKEAKFLALNNHEKQKKSQNYLLKRKSSELKRRSSENQNKSPKKSRKGSLKRLDPTLYADISSRDSHSINKSSESSSKLSSGEIKKKIANAYGTINRNTKVAPKEIDDNVSIMQSCKNRIRSKINHRNADNYSIRSKTSFVNRAPHMMADFMNPRRRSSRMTFIGTDSMSQQGPVRRRSALLDQGGLESQFHKKQLQKSFQRQNCQINFGTPKFHRKNSKASPQIENNFRHDFNRRNSIRSIEVGHQIQHELARRNSKLNNFAVDHDVKDNFDKMNKKISIQNLDKYLKKDFDTDINNNDVPSPKAYSTTKSHISCIKKKLHDFDDTLSHKNDANAGRKNLFKSLTMKKNANLHIDDNKVCKIGLLSVRNHKKLEIKIHNDKLKEKKEIIHTSSESSETNSDTHEKDDVLSVGHQDRHIFPPKLSLLDSQSIILESESEEDYSVNYTQTRQKSPNKTDQQKTSKYVKNSKYSSSSKRSHNLNSPFPISIFKRQRLADLNQAASRKESNNTGSKLKPSQKGFSGVLSHNTKTRNFHKIKSTNESIEQYQKQTTLQNIIDNKEIDNNIFKIESKKNLNSGNQDAPNKLGTNTYNNEEKKDNIIKVKGKEEKSAELIPQNQIASRKESKNTGSKLKPSQKGFSGVFSHNTKTGNFHKKKITNESIEQYQKQTTLQNIIDNKEIDNDIFKIESKKNLNSGNQDAPNKLVTNTYNNEEEKDNLIKVKGKEGKSSKIIQQNQIPIEDFNTILVSKRRTDSTTQTQKKNDVKSQVSKQNIDSSSRFNENDELNKTINSIKINESLIFNKEIKRNESKEYSKPDENTNVCLQSFQTLTSFKENTNHTQINENLKLMAVTNVMEMNEYDKVKTSENNIKINDSEDFKKMPEKGNSSTNSRSMNDSYRFPENKGYVLLNSSILIKRNDNNC